MTLYIPYADELLHGTFGDQAAMDIRAVVVNITGAGTLYTFSAAHQFLTDVPSGSRVAVSGAIAGLTVSSGKLLATDTVIGTVPPGDTAEGLIVYKHTGSDATAKLMEFKTKRQDGTTDISFLGNGGPLTIDWDANGVIRLR
jgi:hypothetical protein